MIRLVLILAVLFGATIAIAQAQPVTLIDADTVRVCDVDPQSNTPPDFGSAACRTENFWRMNTQGQHIWIRARLDLTAEEIAMIGPLGLYISGKASSTVYLNGTLLGSNGQPGASADLEVPGNMDAVLYVPREILRPGENEIIAELSGMLGFLQVVMPMHYLGIGRYADPTDFIIQHYSPALFTFGAFFLGFLYFGLSAVRGEDREGSAIVSLISLFAGAQLLTEVWRGLSAYAYPVHDVRILLIVIFANCFALALIAHLLHRFSGLGLAQRFARLGGVALLLFLVIAISPSYDGKAGFPIFTAVVLGAAWAVIWVVQKKPGALSYLAILVGFGTLIGVYRNQFLDLQFFYGVTGLLLFLFAQQALALIRERRTRRAEEDRSARLETALDLARQQAAPTQLHLVSSGRVEYVSTENIAQLKGAGDYVEVHFESGKTSLYNGSLAGLEGELPPTFLRVHRSHIVNTAFVSALERDGTGIGRLLLSNGMDIPVSRRIMPKVRTVLAAAAE
jgi:hypothetical protein